MNKLNKSLCFFSTFLCSQLVFGQAYETFYLRPGQTISDLLSSDLGITPIYPKNGVLDQVMAFNNLQSSKVKNLPVNFPVKVPVAFYKKSIPEPVASVPRTIQPEWKTNKRINVAAGVLNYSGESSVGGDFNATGGMTKISYQHELSTGNKYLEILPHFSLGYVPDIEGSDLLPSYGIDLSVGLKSSGMAYGAGAGLARNFYIVGDMTTEKVLYASVPRYFLAGQKSFDDSLVDIKLGINSSTEDHGVEIEARPFADLKYSRSIGDNLLAGGTLIFEPRRVADSDQKYIQLLFEISRKF